MSAVAGAFARETGRMLRREFGVGEVVVDLDHVDDIEDGEVTDDH